MRGRVPADAIKEISAMGGRPGIWAASVKVPRLPRRGVSRPGSSRRTLVQRIEIVDPLPPSRNNQGEPVGERTSRVLGESALREGKEKAATTTDEKGLYELVRTQSAPLASSSSSTIRAPGAGTARWWLRRTRPLRSQWCWRRSGSSRQDQPRRLITASRPVSPEQVFVLVCGRGQE